jgi:hypothetical protein
MMSLPFGIEAESVDCNRLVKHRVAVYDRNLVDPASSHMLVSKIKPCMSKYKRFIL